LAGKSQAAKNVRKLSELHPVGFVAGPVIQGRFFDTNIESWEVSHFEAKVKLPVISKSKKNSNLLKLKIKN
jgi:hypothetical protein